SLKKLKSSGVVAPSQDVLEEEVEDYSPSKNVAEEEVHTQGVPTEDIKVPSTATTEVQKEDFSIKRGGTKRKLLGRKGVHISTSSIPIEDRDPDAEHKMCIKYASVEEDDSDCETPVPSYVVVDWELLPTGLRIINVIYRKDNSQKFFTSLREILHLGELKVLIHSPEVNDGSAVWKNQHTWRIQSWKLYSLYGIHVLETVSGLVIYMFVDKKYPLTVKFMERMLDHQLEIDRESVGHQFTNGYALIGNRVDLVLSNGYQLASPEQTAIGKDITNPFMAVMICQKSLETSCVQSRLKQIGCAGKYISQSSSLSCTVVPDW
ncbi:hypothetical protein Tco_1276849, partial [Tanacetum coccineum]